MQFTVKINVRVDLNAQGSTDPDQDGLSYKWFYHAEPSTFARCTSSGGGSLTIEESDQSNAWFIAPNGSGTMHIILAVTDQGVPALTRYKRVIVTVEP